MLEKKLADMSRSDETTVLAERDQNLTFNKQIMKNNQSMAENIESLEHKNNRLKLKVDALTRQINKNSVRF